MLTTINKRNKGAPVPSEQTVLIQQALDLLAQLPPKEREAILRDYRIKAAG